MRRNWPVLQDQLHQNTLVRSMVTLPLGLGSQAIGVLELYALTPEPAKDLDLEAAQTVADLIHTALLSIDCDDQLDTELQAMQTDNVEMKEAASGPAGADPSKPAWLDATSVHRRENVWMAVGMLATASDLTCCDALMLLRARAYAAGQTCDDLAEDLLAERVWVWVLDVASN